MRDCLAWAVVSVASAMTCAAWGNPSALVPDGAAILFSDSMLVLSLAVAAAFVDARTRIVPNAVPAGIVAVHGSGIFLVGACGGDAMPLLAASMGGALAIGGGLLAFTAVYEAATEPGAFGGGDIKLLGALGFALGWQRGAALLMIACVVFALWMLARAARSRICGRPMEHAAPFVPAIAIATYAVLVM